MTEGYRRVPGWVGVAAVVGLAVTLWSNPQFGPPIVAGFSLGFIGLVVGCSAGLLIVGYRAIKSK